MEELDSLDYRILEHVQQDVLQPAHQIGEAVGLSAASVQRRIKKMRRAGVITSVTANVDPHRVGLTVTCIVLVTLATDGTEPVDRLKSIFGEHPQIQQCYYITGSADFALTVVAKSMEDYERLTREVFLDDLDIRSFTTSVVLDRVKDTVLLPMP